MLPDPKASDTLGVLFNIFSLSFPPSAFNLLVFFVVLSVPLSCPVYSFWIFFCSRVHTCVCRFDFSGETLHLFAPLRRDFGAG